MHGRRERVMMHGTPSFSRLAIPLLYIGPFDVVRIQYIISRRRGNNEGDIPLI